MSEQNSPVFRHSTKIVSIKKNIKASKPVVLSHDIPPGTKLTFVDIAHSLATIDIESDLNKFSALVETANEWLQKNYLWKVENCETVGLVFKNERLDPMDFGATQRLIRSSTDKHFGECSIYKGLRIWISRREDVPEMKKHVDLQTLAYKTYLPQGCRFYENQIGWQQLDDILETINESIRTGVISGQLLNIESINYEATEDWVTDTESPKTKGNNAKHQTALRVFYVSNAPVDSHHEEVTVFDFVPDIICANTPPKFEPFSSLLYKIQDFMEENQEYKYLNSQSVDIKFRSVDEMHTYFMVHNNEIGYFLRILRLVCTRVKHRRIERQQTIEMTFPPNEIKSADEELQLIADEKQRLKDSTESDPESIEPFFNIESHCFEIAHNPNALHGPFYPVKRSIEEFLERPEWIAIDYRLPDRHWKFLCAETVTVLAKGEEEIEEKVELSLFSTRHSLFQMPRFYSAVRIFFDTSDVIPNLNYKSRNRGLKKCQSQSFEKRFKTMVYRNKSLPDAVIQVTHNNNTEEVKTIRGRIAQSITCSIM